MVHHGGLKRAPHLLRLYHLTLFGEKQQICELIVHNNAVILHPEPNDIGSALQSNSKTKRKMMNKEMALSTRHGIWQSIADKMYHFNEMLSAPLQMICNYYSLVLERRLNIRQTWALLEAQAAFFLGILPVGYAFVLRAVALVWLIIALKKCKRILA
jgi:hypothetical protein